MAEEYWGDSASLYLPLLSDSVFNADTSPLFIAGGINVPEFFTDSGDFFVSGIEWVVDNTFNFGYTDLYAWGVNKYNTPSERVMLRLLTVIPVEE